MDTIRSNKIINTTSSADYDVIFNLKKILIKNNFL